MIEERGSQATVKPTPTRPIWNGSDVLVISLFSATLLLGGALAFSGLSANEIYGIDRSSLLFTDLMAALEAAALVGGVYLLGMKRKKISWREIGVKEVPNRWLWVAIALAFILIPLIGLIALLIQVILGQPIQNPQLQSLVPKNFSWQGAAGMLLLGGLAVPFAEELFFRGVLYRWLRDRWGPWPGILLSSLVFGLLHGEISIAGANFVIGLALAWAFERSGSLWPSILIHVLNNSLKLALLYTMIAKGVYIPGIQ